MKANSSLALNDAGNMGTVAVGAIITIVVAGVLGVVGLAIMDGVTDSTNLDESTNFATAHASFASGISGAFGMSGTLLLVVVAIAILGLVIKLAM